jgi:hypothetical protein
MMIKPRRMRCMGHVAHMGAIRNVYKVMVGKSEGRCRHRWEDNTKMIFKDIG